MTKSPEYSLTELASLLELELELSDSGNGAEIVSGLATLAMAKTATLSFYANKTYLSELKNCQASVVILHPRDSQHFPGNKLLSSNPYLAYANVSQLFVTGNENTAAIHPSAVVAASANIEPGVEIQANAVIEAGVNLSSGVMVGANCVIGAGVQLGENTRLAPNVTIYSNVIIGCNVIIHAGVVIGSDGFGFASDGKKHHKIAQLGGVTIGDDVEIGAGTCIDCGAINDTQIGNGVKIDNQVQIAHNVIVGDHSIICGCSAIAGSSTIGKNCIIAGGVGVINNVAIADEVTVTAMSLVNQSITKKGVYSSGTGLSETHLWKRNVVRFKQLDDFAKQLHKLDISSKR